MNWPLFRRPGGVWLRLCHAVPHEVVLLPIVDLGGGYYRREA